MENKALREKLFLRRDNGYDQISPQDRESIFAYGEDYKAFLNRSKTERECVISAVELAEAKGFRLWDLKTPVQPGDKVYYVNRKKGIYLAVIGQEVARNGVAIAVAHTDAPRLDIRPEPLWEENEIAYLKTAQYGGILKFQWVTVPLVLHGTLTLQDGSSLPVKIGDEPGDPQFIISDLLPHLGKDRGKESLFEGIPGENLKVIVGSIPMEGDDGKDRVKLEVLRLLHEKYGITERDFASAELQAVPAAEARDIGFDRSLIGAYGHDDRVCAYAGLRALLDLQTPKRTAVCIFADKEEIGSESVTGMQSADLERFLSAICKSGGVGLEDCCRASFCLSVDVLAAFDPTFKQYFDTRNSAYLNHGMGVTKYTGGAGKAGASDAAAEVMGYFRQLLNGKGIVWQVGTMGKVGAGGGGTVAKFMARRNIDTLDAGVPVLSMHAPCELVSKLDCYMTYKGILALFEA